MSLARVMGNPDQVLGRRMPDIRRRRVSSISGQAPVVEVVGKRLYRFAAISHLSVYT